MKKTIALLLMLSFFCTTAMADDAPILEKQVEMRQAHLEWTSEIQKASMEATIEYIEEASENQGAGELPQILEEFNAKRDEAMGLTTHIALNNAIRQLQGITKDFRIENQRLIREYNVKRIQLLARITVALAENEENINDLKDKQWEKKKEIKLEIFDKRVERAQGVLNLLEEKSYDITEAQAKLDDINAKRTDLEEALDSRVNLSVVAVEHEILELSKELRVIVRELQVGIPQEKRIEHWIGVGERALERTNTIIEELEGLGIEVDNLKELHSAAEAELDKAKEAYEEGNLEEAKAAIESFKEALKELKDAYRELVAGNEELSENMEEKVEEVADTLEETVEEMDEEQ